MVQVTWWHATNQNELFQRIVPRYLSSKFVYEICSWKRSKLWREDPDVLQTYFCFYILLPFNCIPPLALFNLFPKPPPTPLVGNRYTPTTFSLFFLSFSPPQLIALFNILTGGDCLFFWAACKKWRNPAFAWQWMHCAQEQKCVRERERERERERTAFR